MDELLSFEISARFALFRKPYTTTSSLTYDFPPRTTIMGLISAILGFERGKLGAEYVKNFENFHVALRILSPISKIRMTFKNLNTKSNPKSTNILTLTEMLYRPRYKLYVKWEEEKMRMLEKALKNHESFYTPYLGIANSLALIKYTGRVDFKEANWKESVAVESVVPKGDNLSFSVREGVKYFLDTLPYAFSEKRDFLSNREYVYTEPGDGIEITVKSNDIVFEADGKHMVFM